MAIKLVHPFTAPVFTSLPSSPSEGQVIAYQTSGMATDNIIWTFKYSLSAGVWSYMGGSPMFVEVTAAVATTSNTYVDLAASVGPSITVPLAGTYMVRHGFTGFGATSTATDIAGMSYAIGGTPAADADMAAASRVDVTTNPRTTVSRERRKAALAAATALVSKYRSSGSQSFTFQDRWMSVTPVFVA